jgi:TonB family protein
VEGDSLSGDEDQIDVTLHISRNGTEQILPFIPHFTFVMKTEADIWRLNEISVAIRVPLADPDFLKNIEQQNSKQNEQGAQMGLQVIIAAENSYHSARGTYACSLSGLMGKGQGSNNAGAPASNGPFADLATGKHAGYVYVISGCDGTQYKVVAEPEVAGSGQRALCSDESGAMRAAADGKATTCLSSGEVVAGARTAGDRATGLAAVVGGTLDPEPQPNSQPQRTAVAPQGARPLRVRVSQGVTQSLVISKVQPTYPPDARIQGSVVMAVVVGKDGNVREVSLVSGHPILAHAAIEAVKQWKFRPYLLNGNPVEVDTQITVNFTPPPN